MGIAMQNPVKHSGAISNANWLCKTKQKGLLGKAFEKYITINL
jgi:hypothetical protein